MKRFGLSDKKLTRLRSIGEARTGRVAKAFTAPPSDGITGLQVYDLRGPASRLNPVNSVFRNEIPRRPAPRGSTGIRWKAITGVNVGNILPGVSEGNRNAPIAHTTAEYSSGYAQLGMEDYNTDESKFIINNTELGLDVDSLTRLGALESLMNAEERVILGGNASIAFGTAPTPVGAAVVTDGASLTAAATVAYIVALTFEGILLASPVNGVATEFARTNADGSVDMVQGGSSNKSLASAAVTPAAGEAILWKWASVPGAAGYAVYIGPSAGGAAGAHCAAIVTVNEYLQTTDPSALAQTADAVTADHSPNPLVFDGKIAQIVKPGSGAQILSLDGEVPTLNSSGTFDEFDELFRLMWESTKSGPARFVTSASTRVLLSKAVMAGSPGTNIQVSVQIGAGGVKTGIQIESILNPYTGQFVPFMNHPYMPKGMIFAETTRLPYSLNGMGAVPWIIETREEYRAQPWPRRTRKTEWGVYCSEGLIGGIPFAHALIQNIGDNI